MVFGFDRVLEKDFLDTQEVSHDGIVIVNICHLLDHLYGKDKWFEVGYLLASKRVREWAEEHGADFYSRPREDFFRSEAVEIARNHGKKMVVVEDLS